MDRIAFAAHMKINKASCNFAVFAILSQSKQFVSQASFQKMTESNIPVFRFEIQWQLVSLQARNRDDCQESLVTDFFFSWCTIFKCIASLISITASEYKNTYGPWKDDEPLLSAPEMKSGEIGIVDNRFPKIRPFLHMSMLPTVFFVMSHTLFLWNRMWECMCSFGAKLKLCFSPTQGMEYFLSPNISVLCKLS